MADRVKRHVEYRRLTPGGEVVHRRKLVMWIDYNPTKDYHVIPVLLREGDTVVTIARGVDDTITVDVLRATEEDPDVTG